MGFGGGFHGGASGPSSASSNTAAGLPFAGIPPDMARMAKHILEKEPDHANPDVEFQHYVEPEPPFTLKRFLYPHRYSLGMATLLVAIETIAALVGPLLIQQGIDRAVIPERFGLLMVFAVIFAVSTVIGAIIGSIRISYTGRLSEKLMYQLRIKLFGHLQRLSMDFYTREKTGVVMSRMTSDVEHLTILFQEGLVNFAVQGLTFFVIVGILFYLNPFLAVISICAALPATFLLSLWFRRVSNDGYNRIRDRIADILSHLSESLAGIRIIQALNRQKYDSSIHQSKVDKYEKANLYTSHASARYTSVTEGIGIAVQAVVLGIGGYFALNGRLSIGELTAFALYITSFFAPIQTLVQLYNTYQQGQAAAGKLRELLSEEPTVVELKNADPMPDIAGQVAVKNLNFEYIPQKPVLTEINLKIAPGETLAIVGPTGGGKSTIAKLLSRFYDPTSGSIEIDGIDLRTVQLESLRSQIAIVPQEPFLFYGSILENLRIADSEATEAEVQQAIESVGLSDLVSQLPGGLDTLCHERGSAFSAGERQLLALARVFLAKPRLLILDEATSNLDLKSESRIEHALDLLLKDKTAILIAHRLSTALRADRVAVIEGGQIQELGSHDELLSVKGRYAQMFKTWQEHGGR